MHSVLPITDDDTATCFNNNMIINRLSYRLCVIRISSVIDRRHRNPAEQNTFRRTHACNSVDKIDFFFFFARTKFNYIPNIFTEPNQNVGY